MYYKIAGSDNKYDTEEEAQQAVMDMFPHAGSDELTDLYSTQIEHVSGICPECGKEVYSSVWGGCCSRQCWRYLYGEVDTGW